MGFSTQKKGDQMIKKDSWYGKIRVILLVAGLGTGYKQ